MEKIKIWGERIPYNSGRSKLMDSVLIPGGFCNYL